MRLNLINDGGIGGAALLAAAAVVVGVTTAGPAVAPSGASAAPAVTLGEGHVDAVAGRIVNGRLRLLVKDATAGSTRVRWRDPRTVTLRLTGRARVTLPAGLSFVGAAGSRAWLIPQVQRSGVIWAGWNTEELSSRQLRGPLTWRLSRVTGPGRAVIYQTGSFGKASVLFSSAQRTPQSRSLPLGVHVHANWAFTKPGTYRMSFSLSGYSRAGKALSDSGTLRIQVG